MSAYRVQHIEPEADPFPSCKLCGYQAHEYYNKDGKLVATWGPCQRPPPKPLPPKGVLG